MTQLHPISLKAILNRAHFATHPKLFGNMVEALLTLLGAPRTEKTGFSQIIW